MMIDSWCWRRAVDLVVDVLLPAGALLLMALGTAFAEKLKAVLNWATTFFARLDGGGFMSKRERTPVTLTFSPRHDSRSARIPVK